MSTIDTPSNHGPWEQDLDLSDAETDTAVEEFLYDLAVTDATLTEVEKRLDNPRTEPRQTWRQRVGYLTADLASQPGTADIDLSAPLSDEDALDQWPGV